MSISFQLSSEIVCSPSLNYLMLSILPVSPLSFRWPRPKHPVALSDVCLSPIFKLISHETLSMMSITASTTAITVWTLWHHITGTAFIIRLKLYVYIVENSETFQKIYRFMQFKWANFVSLAPIVYQIGKKVVNLACLRTIVARSRLLYGKSFNYNQTIYDSVHNLVYVQCFVYAYLCLQRVFPWNNVTQSLSPKHSLIRHEPLSNPT